MGLLRLYLRREIAELHSKNVRLRVIGDRSRLAEDIQDLIINGEEKTKNNTGLNLILAFKRRRYWNLEHTLRQPATLHKVVNGGGSGG